MVGLCGIGVFEVAKVFGRSAAGVIFRNLLSQKGLSKRPAEGIEPTTPALQKLCSTVELRWLKFIGRESSLSRDDVTVKDVCNNCQAKVEMSGISAKLQAGKSKTSLQNLPKVFGVGKLLISSARFGRDLFSKTFFKTSLQRGGTGYPPPKSGLAPCSDTLCRTALCSVTHEVLVLNQAKNGRIKINNKYPSCLEFRYSDFKFVFTPRVVVRL